MSTSSVYPLNTEQAFRVAHEAGFDGIEIMITSDPGTQSADVLLALSRQYGLPILSIHAPVLLTTHFVWGRDPLVKLERSAELARAAGASTVVVHPPFRWQTTFAPLFLAAVRVTSISWGIEVAVENMFDVKIGRRGLATYAPGWDPSKMDCDAMTLDFSHASLSGRDSLDLALAMGDRLRHVHLCDGSGALGGEKMFDEHLVPGHGNEPVASVLQLLARHGWSGSVIAEINTRRTKTDAQRLAMLTETVDFARRYLLVDADSTNEPAADLAADPALATSTAQVGSRSRVAVPAR